MEATETTETKLKEISNHQIRIERFLSGDDLVCKVSLNDSLKELLSEFVVRGQFAIEEYNDQKVKRYKIKSILRNSHDWHTSFVYFFTKECVDDGSIEIKFSHEHLFKNFIDALRYFRGVVKLMEELRRKETMVISYKVER